MEFVAVVMNRSVWVWHPPPGGDPGPLLQAQHSQLYLIGPASRNSLHKLLCHQLLLCAHHKFSVPPHFGKRSCPESYNCVM